MTREYEGPWLVVIVWPLGPVRPFKLENVWQVKELQERFLDVWQGKELWDFAFWAKDSWDAGRRTGSGALTTKV